MTNTMRHSPDIPKCPLPLRGFPVISSAGRYPLRDQDFSQHYQGRTHAIHLYDYEGTIRMEDHEFPLRPGALTLSVAGGVTRYHLPSPGHHWCVHFIPLKVSKGESFEMPWILDTGPMASHVVERFRGISQLYLQGRLGEPGSDVAEASASVALQDLLLWIGRWAMATESGSTPRGAAAEIASLALGIIDERFAEEATVPALLKEVGVSHNRTSRCFTERIGMSPARYRLQRRIEHAQLLLRTTRLSVKEIAQMVGIPDAQHFNKQFRRIAGTSPSDARDRE